MSRHAYGDGWNFWVVKYLRQMRHDFALPVAVIILLVIEFIIFRSFLGQRHYSPQWPWCLIFMSVLCGGGTTLCVGDRVRRDVVFDRWHAAGTFALHGLFPDGCECAVPRFRAEPSADLRGARRAAACPSG